MKFETNPLRIQQDTTEVLDALEYHEPVEISFGETNHVNISGKFIKMMTEQNNLVQIILNGYTINSDRAGVESWETMYIPVDDGGTIVEIMDC